MTVFAVACTPPKTPELTGIFPEKKLDPGVKNMLSQDRLPHDTFYDWWERTELDRDLRILVRDPFFMDANTCCTTTSNV